MNRETAAGGQVASHVESDPVADVPTTGAQTVVDRAAGAPAVDDLMMGGPVAGVLIATRSDSGPVTGLPRGETAARESVSFRRILIRTAPARCDPGTTSRSFQRTSNPLNSIEWPGHSSRP